MEETQLMCSSYFSIMPQSQLLHQSHRERCSIVEAEAKGFPSELRENFLERQRDHLRG